MNINMNHEFIREVAQSSGLNVIIRTTQTDDITDEPNEPVTTYVFIPQTEINNYEEFIPPPELSFDYRALKELPIDHILFMRPMSIDCIHNYLTELPNNLPDSIWNINCSHNHIHKLPDVLPPELFNLTCENNNISILPTTLPRSLVVLNVKDNPLMSLPDNLYALTSLAQLNITKCLITVLPELPSSLSSIVFYESDPICEYVKQNGVEIPTNVGLVHLANEQIQILNEVPTRKRVQARTRLLSNELKEHYARRTMHPNNLSPLLKNPAMDVSSFLDTYIDGL